MVADTVFDTVFDIVKDMNWNALTQRRSIADQYQFRSRSQDQSFQYLKISKRQCKIHDLPSVRGALLLQQKCNRNHLGEHVAHNGQIS